MVEEEVGQGQIVRQIDGLNTVGCSRQFGHSIEYKQMEGNIDILVADQRIPSRSSLIRPPIVSATKFNHLYIFSKSLRSCKSSRRLGRVVRGYTLTVVKTRHLIENVGACWGALEHSRQDSHVN